MLTIYFFDYFIKLCNKKFADKLTLLTDVGNHSPVPSALAGADVERRVSDELKVISAKKNRVEFDRTIRKSC